MISLSSKLTFLASIGVGIKDEVALLTLEDDCVAWITLFFDSFIRLGSAEEGKSCVKLGSSSANVEVGADKVIIQNTFIIEEHKTFPHFFFIIYDEPVF
jgi:hypothetical protein